MWSPWPRVAYQRGFSFYLWRMHGLSARAAIRGKSATKNIRKFVFPEVFFGLLARTNRSFCMFPEVLFDSLERTNRSFVVFPEVFFGLLARTNRSFCVFSEVFFGLFPIVKGLGRPDSSTTELYDDVNA